MGLLKRIEQIVNGIAPEYSNIHLIPRFIPIFSDPILKGVGRFCKRVGNNVAIIDPDVEMKITQDDITRTNKFPVDNLSPWLVLGGIMSIGPDWEYAILNDYSTTDKTITLDRMLTASYGTNNTIQLYAVPIEFQAAALKGATNVVVKTGYKMVNGDSIGYFFQDGILESLIEIKVTIARFLAATPSPDGMIYNYELTLETPLTRDVNTDTELFLMTFPAYISSKILYPDSFIGSSFIGPFAIDYLSGRLNEGSEVDEVWSIQSEDRYGNLEQPVPMKVDKNHIITNVPVSADVLLFWDMVYGSMQYTPGYSVGLCDSRGYWTISYQAIPQMPAGTEWTVFVKSETDCKVRVAFLPNAYREFDLLANTPTFINIGTLPSEQAVERIELVCVSAPDNKIYWGDWQPTTPMSVAIYTYLIGNVRKAAVWNATGLIVKPLFYNLDLLRFRYDVGNKYDSGFIYL